MNADAILDAIDMYCPVPALLTTEKMKELKSGDILVILANDPDILEDIPNWCKRSGNRFLKIEKENEIYKLYVQK